MVLVVKRKSNLPSFGIGRKEQSRQVSGSFDSFVVAPKYSSYLQNNSKNDSALASQMYLFSV